MPILLQPTTAQKVAQDIVNETNTFIDLLKTKLTQGVIAPETGGAVSASDLQAALGSALPKLQVIVATAD